MPWLRTGDDAAMYPKLMEIYSLDSCEPWSINEVAGFIWRIASQSAGHCTDYVLDLGTLHTLGQGRGHILIEQAVAVGLLEKVGPTKYKLVEDPDFIHIRLKADIEWERIQQQDSNDPKIRVPVMLRDGDNCRWCGHRVQWLGRGSKRRATFDHLQPGKKGTPETVVIACKGCNSSRQNNPAWDDEHTLRPAPKHPQYSKYTAEYLTENGHSVQPNIGYQPEIFAYAPKNSLDAPRIGTVESSVSGSHSQRVRSSDASSQMESDPGAESETPPETAIASSDGDADSGTGHRGANVSKPSTAPTPQASGAVEPRAGDSRERDEAGLSPQIDPCPLAPDIGEVSDTSPPGIHIKCALNTHLIDIPNHSESISSSIGMDFLGTGRDGSGRVYSVRNGSERTGTVRDGPDSVRDCSGEDWSGRKTQTRRRRRRR